MPLNNGHPEFLVAGAAGQTGKWVTQLLLAKGHSVRAFVHTDDDRARELAAAGADVFVGDLLHLDDVSHASTGVRAAYFVYPLHPGLLDATAIFAQAATDAGVAAVVNMSQICARKDAGSHASQRHWIGERMLDRYPFSVTHVRPTMFAENLIIFSHSIANEDVIRLPFGDGRHAPITAKDQAQVIASIMENPEPHNGQTYPLCGPVEMDYSEIAAVFSRVLDRPVSYDPAPVDQFAHFIAQMGLSEYFIQHLGNVAIDYQKGLFAGTNDHIQKIGGLSPTSLEDFIESNRVIYER